MGTDQNFARKNVRKTEFNNTKCNLQWQIAFKITYSQEVLDRCEEICYLSFDWSQYSSHDDLSCLCNKPGKIREAREFWMEQSVAKHQNKEYRTFPLHPRQPKFSNMLFAWQSAKILSVLFSLAPCQTIPTLFSVWQPAKHSLWIFLSGSLTKLLI